MLETGSNSSTVPARITVANPTTTVWAGCSENRRLRAARRADPEFPRVITEHH